MESKGVTSESAQGTRLGSLDVTLMLDPGTSAHATKTTVNASDRVAPEVVQVIGSLLFAERQMRAISDPARIAAADEMAEAARAARAATSAPGAPSPTRASASFHIDVYANGNFRINVEQRLDGLLRDVAGGLTASALTTELLVTLGGPYREFYREMLEAANYYWRDRRPSSIESTWTWSVALRRMNQVVGQNLTEPDDTAVCESCKSVRPAGSPCLRCGAAGAMARPIQEAPIAYAPVVPAPVVAPEPVVPPRPAEPPPQSRPPLPPPASNRIETEHTILRARDLLVESEVVEPDPRMAWPLASFPRRLGALVLDLISGIILGVMGGAGLTALLIASGGFAPGDSTSAFTTAAVLVILALYLSLGWIKGETLGMLVFRLRIVRASDRAPAGLIIALRRGIGTLLLVLLAVGVFGGLVALDNSLDFIQGMADVAMKVIATLLGLYILWIGLGQPILSRPNRQTWGDRMAGTVVVVRQS